MWSYRYTVLGLATLAFFATMVARLVINCNHLIVEGYYYLQHYVQLLLKFSHIAL